MIRAAIHSVLVAAIFAGSLVLGCGLITRALPFPPVPQVGEKLAHFTAHRDDYTALFVGSSHFRRQIVPSLFDQLAAQRGLDMRTFNFGVDSLMAPEDDFVVEHILATRPARMRWVFLEITMFRGRFENQAPETQRASYWHDAPRTWLVAQWVRGNAKPFKRKKWRKGLEQLSEQAELIAGHARLFLKTSTNLGRGSALFSDFARPGPGRDWFAPLGPALDGFIPSDPGLVVRGEQRAQYESELAALREKGARRRPLDPVAQRCLETTLARIRAAGAQPVLVIAPTTHPFVFHPSRDTGALLLDFTDPHQWPELFAPDMRADSGHMNGPGAELWTQRVAERFLAFAAPPK